MSSALLDQFSMLLPRGWRPPAAAPGPAFRAAAGPAPVSEPYQSELIRAYASSGVAAVVTINSGALIAVLSQASHLAFVPPVAIGLALLIWALGVTTGVATWGAAFHSIEAQVSGDPENQLRWRNVATDLFHVSLAMFLLGFLAIGAAALI
jgi:hypothetical protein